MVGSSFSDFATPYIFSFQVRKGYTADKVCTPSMASLLHLSNSLRKYLRILVSAYSTPVAPELVCHRSLIPPHQAIYLTPSLV